MYCFRSKYALTLWEIVSKRGNMRYKSREEFELERFRRLLGVEDEKYKLMNDLERFVIKPALREVNAFSSYHVQLERVRVGKRVERVILTWVGKENAELKETYKLIGGHSAVRAAAYRGRKTRGDA
jgi:plasmid replication initiation protein